MAYKLTFSLTLVAAIVSALFAATPPVKADVASDAKAYCQQQYPDTQKASNSGGIGVTNVTQTLNRQACENGYTKGNGSGNTCSQYNGATKSACEDGYGQKAKATRVNNPPSSVPTPPPSTLQKGEPGYDYCYRQYPPPLLLVYPEACVDGYENATGDGTTCAKYSSSPSVQEACEDGYSQQVVLNGSNRADEVRKCEVGFLGMIICWISKFITLMVSGVFNLLTQLMITPAITDTVIVDTGDRTDSKGANIQSSTLFDTWRIFNGVANLIFIGLLLAVILSHTTGMGIDNYTLKKMLPRIVVGAILINVSFIICQILVDLSNIFGSALFGVLRNISGTIGGVQPAFSFGSGTIIVLLTAGVGTFLYINILALLPMLTAGLFALLTTVLVLVVRQALIIIFVVISPIAFALNILPNTQSWFSKWWQNFVTLLMLYPAIAFVFGASQIFAAVVSRGAPAKDLGSIGYVVFILIALAVQVLPFFFTPLIVKASGRLTSQLAGRLGAPLRAASNAATKRASELGEDLEKKRAISALNNNKNGVYGRLTRRKAIGERVAGYHESQLKSGSNGAYDAFRSDPSTANYLARKVSRDSALGNRVSKRNEIRGNMDTVTAQINIAEVEAADAMITDEEYTLQELRDSIDSGKGKDGRHLSEGERAAIYKRIAEEGTLDDIHNLTDKLAEATNADRVRDNFVKGIANNAVAKNAAHLDANGQNAIRAGASTGQLFEGAVNRGAYNPETLASQPTAALNGLQQYSGSYTSAGRAALEKSRDTVLGKTKYSTQVTSAGKQHLGNL